MNILERINQKLLSSWERHLASTIKKVDKESNINRLEKIAMKSPEYDVRVAALTKLIPHINDELRLVQIICQYSYTSSPENAKALVELAFNKLKDQSSFESLAFATTQNFSIEDSIQKRRLNH